MGRNESRDFLDILEIHKNNLSLGALCWAACGKDPGYNPDLLIDLLKRRGHFHQDDFSKLHLAQKVSVQDLKSTWFLALKQAEEFVKKCPESLIGCLFYSKQLDKFVTPIFDEKLHFASEIKPHFCQKGGVIPSLQEIE